MLLYMKYPTHCSLISFGKPLFRFKSSLFVPEERDCDVSWGHYQVFVTWSNSSNLLLLGLKVELNPGRPVNMKLKWPKVLQWFVHRWSKSKWALVIEPFLKGLYNYSLCFFSFSFFKGLFKAVLYQSYINKVCFPLETIYYFIPLPCLFCSDRISNFVHRTDIPLLLPNYKPRCYCVLMQTYIDTHVTGSPSVHCGVQNTHGDGILSGRGGLGEHQTTGLIRQCADCICFPFVSRLLRCRHSVVINPLSETELDKSWSGSSGSIMRWEQELPVDKCQWTKIGLPPMNILL